MYFKDHEMVRSTVYIVQNNIKDHSLENSRVIKTIKSIAQDTPGGSKDIIKFLF